MLSPNVYIRHPNFTHASLGHSNLVVPSLKGVGVGTGTDFVVDPAFEIGSLRG